VLSGVSLSSFDNPNLHWEKTYQYNAGLELSFFKNRFLFSVDYYQKRTKDLLINMAIPSDNGFLSYNTNLGEIENAGLEIESEVKLFTKTFKWSVNGNISFNSNKVIDLGQNKMILGRNLIPTGLDQIGTVAMPGYNVGAFYGYKVLGIYQNAAEIAAGPVDPINPQPGDFKYADINKDGRITTDDRSIIGNPTPKYIFGLSNTFSYKKFDLSIFVMGKIKYAVLNLNRFYSDGLVYSASGNLRKEAFDKRWTGEGTSNYYPRAKRTGSLFDKRISDFLVEDGSFIRLKNINFSYNLDVKKLKYISNLKVFANVSNLFTITNYKGYDPEVSGLGLTSLNQNIDLGTIPLYRSYSFGVNVGF
jgi:outer membrane receptor protein involved in Fe transport